MTPLEWALLIIGILLVAFGPLVFVFAAAYVSGECSREEERGE